MRLQGRNRFTRVALKTSNAMKVFLYLFLLLVAIYWSVKGDFLDFWDAFLWLVAFFFIKLNVVEWRHEARTGSA